MEVPTVNRRLIFAAALIAYFAAPVVGPARSLAGEHPEHPKKTESKAEHPEHPGAQSGRKTLTADDMAKGIQAYVTQDSALKGGRFLVYDPVQAKVLDLKLTKIHLDKLAQVSAGLYFACCDFTATDGHAYDVDFWMKEGAEGLAVSEIKVHKVDGVPRYAWVEKDGVWSTAAK
jgi:hypothetical protein